MRAFVVEEFGKPGSVREVEDAKPESGDLLVRVHAAGVNPADAGVVNGYLVDYAEHRFPLVPGVEFSGEVVEAPEGSAFGPGDTVYGAPDRDWYGEGTYADLLRIDPANVAPVPASTDHVGAAGITVAGLTALEGVDATGLGEGQTLLIVGATGGVGSYAVQLAALKGIRVIAVSRGENLDLARDLGAADTIDYTKGDVSEQVLSAHPDGVDAVYDTYSDAEGLEKLAGVVKEGGALVSPKGAAANAEAFEAKGRRGINANRAALDRLSELNELIEAGKLRLPPTTTYPVEQANEALAEVAQGHVRGKLALVL